MPQRWDFWSKDTDCESTVYKQWQLMQHNWEHSQCVLKIFARRIVLLGDEWISGWLNFGLKHHPLPLKCLISPNQSPPGHIIAKLMNYRSFISWHLCLMSCEEWYSSSRDKLQMNQVRGLHFSFIDTYAKNPNNFQIVIKQISIIREIIMPTEWKSA